MYIGYDLFVKFNRYANPDWNSVTYTIQSYQETAWASWNWEWMFEAPWSGAVHWLGTSGQLNQINQYEPCNAKTGPKIFVVVIPKEGLAGWHQHSQTYFWYDIDCIEMCSFACTDMLHAHSSGKTWKFWKFLLFRWSLFLNLYSQFYTKRRLG